ncbi:MAG: putative arabinose efflux permease, family [Hyphomicrobiales bacterium]|nr:putative arabinose efflux permease, family [Hyphomicrobiales bacterium]
MPQAIPRLIKRNIALLALSLSFAGAGMQFAYGFGPLMVVSLTGSSALAGLSVGLIGLSRFLVAYPIGKITDTFGRKPGVMFGLVLALFGTLTLYASMALHSIVLFTFGLLVFGMGMNASQQMRVAATDMVPPRLRAQALGYVALGSLFGLVLSPVMVQLAEVAGSYVGQDPLGMPWLFLPALILLGMFILSFVRPDPKHIGMNLQKYYPDEKAHAQERSAPAGQYNAWRMFRDPALRLAIVSNSAATGNMSIVMVLTSLVLSHHGHSLLSIAVSHMFHSVGMFAFTIPLGRLADRHGRMQVMMPGVATTLVGAALLAFTSSWILVTLGTFLVGLGWAGANVAATALIADRSSTQERGRAIGFNDTFAGATSVFAALMTGPALQWSGLPATGITAVCLAAIPLGLFMVQRQMRLAH